MLTNINNRTLFLILFLLLPIEGIVLANKTVGRRQSRIIHVAKSGNDSYNGSSDRPLLTISKAALLAKPGDKVLIHKGIYREEVKLTSGGTSDAGRITFAARPGEEVSIKGSEPVKSWIRETATIWRAEVENLIFGQYNPFVELINPNDEQKFHLGAVYLDNIPLKEVIGMDEVSDLANTWAVMQEHGKTVIRANFGSRDPTATASLTEINVRNAIFSGKPGVNYVSLEGLNIAQAATAAAAINGEQPGAISANGGTHWIIQDCAISDSRSVGISIGQTGHSYAGTPRKPEYSDLSDDIALIGHHQIRNNHIFRCGQAGIFGLLQGSTSFIANNLIEDINTDQQYSGVESAGIRLAVAIDAVISHNLIRRIGGKDSGYGIFMGPLFQGARITGNVIAETQHSSLYFYNNHGPVTIDNNVFSATGAKNDIGIKMVGSEANVFLQNLFYNCAINNERSPGRAFATSNYLPHSLVIKQTIPSLNIDHQFYSNLFIKKGLSLLPKAAGCRADFNGYADGALPAAWGDKQSKLSEGASGYSLAGRENKVTLTIDLKGIQKVSCPALTASFIGMFALSKQYLEYPDGRLLTLNRDFFGNVAAKGSNFPGPFYRRPAKGYYSLFTYKPFRK